MSMRDLEQFIDGYVECAFWCGIDDEAESVELAPECMAEMRADCEAFLESEREDLEQTGHSWGYLGHDFWLTRNRHGAGFWDRGLGELGDRLTNAAHAYGEVDLVVGDDGLVYS